MINQSPGSTNGHPDQHHSQEHVARGYDHQVMWSSFTHTCFHLPSTLLCLYWLIARHFDILVHVLSCRIHPAEHASKGELSGYNVVHTKYRLEDNSNSKGGLTGCATTNLLYPHTTSTVIDIYCDSKQLDAAMCIFSHTTEHGGAMVDRDRTLQQVR